MAVERRLVPEPVRLLLISPIPRLPLPPDDRVGQASEPRELASPSRPLLARLLSAAGRDVCPPAVATAARSWRRKNATAALPRSTLGLARRGRGLRDGAGVRGLGERRDVHGWYVGQGDEPFQLEVVHVVLEVQRESILDVCETKK